MSLANGSVKTPELGIALIGCGGIAGHYRDNYANLPGVAYRLVVDVNEELARTVAAECGAAHFSTDWRDALTPDIQIADISTPNYLHAEQATALLAHGAHVVLQKPLAPTIAECREIVQAAQKNGRQAGVYMSDLEDPLVWDLRDIVQGGYLGRVSQIRARYAHRGGLNAAPSSWRGSAEKTGGGAFIQLSLHHTNLFSWMLDDTIETVMGYSKNLMCPNIGGDDMTTCVTEFARTGIVGIFDSAWNADGTGLEIYGSEGSVKMLGGQGAAVEARLNRPFVGRIIAVPEAGQKATIPSSGSMKAQSRPDNPLNQHIHFVQCVQNNRAFPVTAETGLYDVAVVKAVYESAAQGRRVAVAEML